MNDLASVFWSPWSSDMNSFYRAIFLFVVSFFFSSYTGHLNEHTRIQADIYLESTNRVGLISPYDIFTSTTT